MIYTNTLQPSSPKQKKVLNWSCERNRLNQWNSCKQVFSASTASVTPAVPLLSWSKVNKQSNKNKSIKSWLFLTRIFGSLTLTSHIQAASNNGRWGTELRMQTGNPWCTWLDIHLHFPCPNEVHAKHVSSIQSYISNIWAYACLNWAYAWLSRAYTPLTCLGVSASKRPRAVSLLVLGMGGGWVGWC